MAQFDVYRNANQIDVYRNANQKTAAAIPYLLNVQTDLLESLVTRVVVPLLRASEMSKPAKGLNPKFEVEGTTVIMSTAELAGVPVPSLQVCQYGSWEKGSLPLNVGDRRSWLRWICSSLESEGDCPRSIAYWKFCQAKKDLSAHNRCHPCLDCYRVRDLAMAHTSPL
jgi:toxin CcdB